MNFLIHLSALSAAFLLFAEDDGVVGVSACSHVLLTEFYIQFMKNYVRTHGRYNTPCGQPSRFAFPTFPSSLIGARRNLWIRDYTSVPYPSG